MKALLSILIIGLLLFSACGTLTSERQEIITFTREALEIEAKRSELIEYFASFRPSEYGYHTRLWLIDRDFLGGVPAKSVTLRTGDKVPPSSIEGMASLRKRLLLLDCPQSTQSIKDALDQIYNSEIELAELQLSQKDLPCLPHFGNGLVLCEITKDNLSYWRQLADQNPSWTKVVQSDWFKAQDLRLEVYTRWAEILKEHDIDPLEEGLTSLIE